MRQIFRTRFLGYGVHNYDPPRPTRLPDITLAITDKI